jgi:CHAT domain-containing protein
MNKSNSLIVIFLIFFSSFVNGEIIHQKVAVDVAAILESNQKIKNDSSLSLDQKNTQIITELNKVRQLTTNDEFKKILRDVEDIVLIKCSKIEAVELQVAFLLAQLNRQMYEGDNSYKDSWVFQTSKDQVFETVEALFETKTCESGCPKANEIPFVVGILQLIKTPYYFEQGKYEEADILIKSMILNFENIPNPALLGNLEPEKDWVGIQKAYLYEAYILKLELAKRTGTFGNAIKEAEFIDKNFYEVVDYFKRNEDDEPETVYFKFRNAYEIDKYLGKYKEVIKKAKYLLDKLPETEDNLDVLRAKSILMKDIGEAYEKLKYHDLSKRYLFKSWTIDLKTGVGDARSLGYRIMYQIELGNYELAESELKHAVWVLHDAGVDCTNRNEMANNETCQFIVITMGYVGKLKVATNAKDKNNLRKTYWLLFAHFFETTFLNNHGTQVSTYDNPFLVNMNLLNGYAVLHDAFLAGDNKIMASFYAKNYINTLQTLRSQLSENNKSDITVFTDSHADNIKKFAGTFYDIGDENAAWSCLNIIKQNQYLDYVRRRGIDESFLSKIPTSTFEDDFLIKLKTISYEIEVLKKQKSKSSNLDKNEVEKIETSLSNTINKKNKLIANFKTQAAKTNATSSNKTKISKINFLNLNDDEAAIQYSFTNGQLSILVATRTDSKRIKIPIPKDEFIANIYDINLALATNKFVSKEKINALSKWLIDEPFKYLKGKKITVIKFQTDDALTMLPIAILKFADVAVGELYAIENMRLIGGKFNNLLLTNNNLSAFGASQGNSEFSKLPAVKKEVEALVNIDADSRFNLRTSYLDDGFNRNNFYKSFTDKTSLIHVSTHFKSTGNLANNTKMLFGDGTTETVEDISRTLPAIDTFLVTLSACNTGNVFVSNNGASYEGLSNIFQLKGARNVISTLWEISDQGSSDFMIIFYSILFNNDIKPSEALTYTQTLFRTGDISKLPKKVNFKKDLLTIETLKNLKKYEHPYFWAAFQISTVN